ncbi:uncharacterized protein LOC130190775 isoform X2 [Pseudoliparis swirei]|uniref:uncharacterized protein LOC130190775 isoform X2 n=1 Tax=Pseudoliparis swirei TaxID=2059687 RepID=UPI0024BE7C46|nr:uncharacterized protein LOC130190775 isoform X2 [Pseudoliparis swirei]
MHSLLSREKKEEEAGFGIDLGLSPGFLPQAATMFSCVGCFWVLLSSALVAVCSFSFISPAWIVKDQLRNNQHHQHQHNNKDSVSFGLLWHCSESLDHMYRCYTFGGLGKFAEIPSSSWQIGHVASQAELAGVQLVGSRFRRTLASVPNNRRMDTSGPRPPGQHERERKGLCSKLAHTHTHTHTHIPCPLLTNSSAQRIGRGAVKPPVNRKPPLHS